MNPTLALALLPLIVCYVAARRFVLPAIREMRRSMAAACEPDPDDMTASDRSTAHG